MYLFRAFIVILFSCGLGFSSVNPFDAVDWDAYRLKGPEQSRAVIKTPRLDGVPVTEESFDALLEGGDSIFSQLPVLTHWAGSRTDTPENKERWKAFLGRAKNRAAANLLSWRGFYSNSEPKTFLGFVGSHRHPNTGSQHDGAIEMIYAFDSQHWRQGYATEAVAAYMSSDIGRLENYRYVFITTHPDNAASIALAEKMGLQEWELDSSDPSVPGYLQCSQKGTRRYFKLDKSESR